MPYTHAVGIDLGTTYSAVARLDESGRTVMVRNGHGELLTPSVVLFEDSEVIVGKDAKKILAVDPDRVADCAKRDVGEGNYWRPIRGTKLPAEVIQSCILRRLKEDITAALGSQFKTVITVPAYFDERRRKATSDAAEMAGLDLLDIVNEPTAAALAFGEQLGYLTPHGAPQRELTVLVYDLGGGTFDVTVLRLAKGEVRTLATDGDVRLGGRDWDERVVRYVSEQFRDKYQIDPRTHEATFARLLIAAEEAKHTLTQRDHATVHVEFQGRAAEVPITRAKFAELTEDLLERTSYTTRQVLAAAGLDWSKLDEILLVGGSTRMPMVPVMLQQMSGITPKHSVNPDEAVARGAAVFAGYLMANRNPSSPPPAFRVGDVNAHSLGIEGVDPRTLRKENVILIPRNTILPAKKTERFMTKTAGQKSIIVQVLEGESRLPHQCTPVAKAVMRQLPEGLPAGWPIDVCYEYGTNGRLAVNADVPGTKLKLHLELERESGLSAAGLAKWKQIVGQQQGFSSFEMLLQETLDLFPADGAKQPANPAQAHKTPASIPMGTAVPKAAMPNTGMPNAQNQPRPASRPVPVQPAPQGSVKPPVIKPAADVEDDFEYELEHPQPSQAAQDQEMMIVGGGSSSLVASFRRRRSNVSVIVNLVGHVVAAGGGLALGYWILVWLNPQANFLQLNLPGLPPPVPVQAAPLQ